MALTEMNYIEGVGGIDLNDPDVVVKEDSSNTTTSHTVTTTTKPKYINWLITDSQSTGYMWNIVIDVEEHKAKLVSWGGSYQENDNYTSAFDLITNITNNGFTWYGLLGGTNRTEHNVMYVYC